jgi:predicted MarR family transcription regulator
MDGQDSSPQRGDDQLSDTWWASLARLLLHRVQVEIIEALRRSDRPLSARDLAGIVEGTEAGHLAHHHLRRLRKVGAIAYAEGRMSRNATETHYRLVAELGDDER